MPRRTRRVKNSDLSPISSTNVEKIIKQVTRRNVRYIQGIPRSIANVENTYTIVLVSSLQALTLTTGGIANATSLDITSRVDTWSRWSAVFNQYIIGKIVVATRVNNSTNAQGSIFVKLDETSSTPSSTMIRSERAQINLFNSQVEDEISCTSVWEPRSAEDMTWVTSTTGATPIYLKTYADPTNTLTNSGDSTTKIVHTLYYTVIFRYLASS